jgi:hypothetical protein
MIFKIYLGKNANFVEIFMTPAPSPKFFENWYPIHTTFGRAHVCPDANISKNN